MVDFLKSEWNKIRGASMFTVIFAIFLLSLAIFLLFFYADIVRKITLKPHQKAENYKTEAVLGMKEQITLDIKKLDKQLSDKIPKSYYMVINTSSNEFYLYKNTELVKKDICSTGSYVLLKNGDNQEWMFKTPKGEFKIRNKNTAPVWKKPDWAFVEEGLRVPSPNHSSRFEYGVLGDYSLSLGQGYLIHGTLYQRFLGLPVTHGCVRLNDENLELIYKKMAIGSKVFIF
jgi:L,D-transpeptidase ErfK/SrfK